MKFLIILVATIAVAFAGTVEINLLRRVQKGETDEAILEFRQVIDEVVADPALNSLDMDIKVPALREALKGATGAIQAPYVALAKSLGLEVQQLWISNVILVTGLNAEKLAKLEAAPGDFIIRAQNIVHIMPVIAGKEVNITQNEQWGVRMVRAHEVWPTPETGRGQGTCAMVIDTGFNVDHVALAPRFNNNAAGWLDPYYGEPRPTDGNGHGSHCAGSILGSSNGVGVAPEAQLVGCRGLNGQGSGSEAIILRCAQFALTVTPKPTVVSNSWGGGSGLTWYNSAVTAWKNVDIIPVFALGNSGSACRTANSPGDQPGLIGVGATTNTDAMASFSSRGPVGNLQKPEVSAPGANIVSCGTGANNYVTMSGTSMATPHVAGVVCLIKAKYPRYTYQEVLDALQRAPATPDLSNADRNCGLPTPGQDFPNHAYGHGRVDAVTATMT